MKAFCANPSQDSLLALINTMNEIEGKKCRCIVAEWRSTFSRHGDRWIENTGPTGRCGVVTVSTLIPDDVRKMGKPPRPVLWTLQQKMVTTQGTDDPLCTSKPEWLRFYPPVKDETITLKWNAPRKSLDCSEFEFTSTLKGMIDPRGPKGK